MLIKNIYSKIRTLQLILHSNFELRKVSKGDNNNVFGHIDIVNPKQLLIGNGCSFNHGCYIHAGNGITLGDDVTLSAHVCMVSMGIDYKDWASGNKHHTSCGRIRIGNHVWIGAKAIILPGVQITGEYVVVAANSVVNRDIHESRCIFAGNPAVLVRSF